MLGSNTTPPRSVCPTAVFCPQHPAAWGLDPPLGPPYFSARLPSLSDLPLLAVACPSNASLSLFSGAFLCGVLRVLLSHSSMSRSTPHSILLSSCSSALVALAFHPFWLVAMPNAARFSSYCRRFSQSTSCPAEYLCAPSSSPCQAISGGLQSPIRRALLPLAHGAVLSSQPALLRVSA